MKKFLFIVAFMFAGSNMALAVIEEEQEIKTSQATYLCKRKSCTRTAGKEEEGVEFQYTFVITSNSGKSSSKKRYNCITNKNGAVCKALP